MNELSIPDLYCPFPSAVNPHVEDAETYAIDWARDQGAMKGGDRFGISDAHVGYLCACIYPRISREALLAGTSWLDWLLLYDDIWNDKKARVDELTADRIRDFQANVLRVLAGLPTGDHADPLHRSLADVRSRLLRLRPDWDPKLFIRMFQNYLQANTWEVLNIWEGKVPRLSAYTTMRRHTSCMLPTYEVSCVLAGIRLSRRTRSHVAVEQLIVSSINYLCWLNDIFSFRREQLDGTTTNLIFVLQQEFGCTAQEAITRAAEMCRAEIETYLEFKERLPRLGLPLDGDLQGFLGLMESWMRGLLDWSRLTLRYHVPAEQPA